MDKTVFKYSFLKIVGYLVIISLFVIIMFIPDGSAIEKYGTITVRIVRILGIILAGSIFLYLTYIVIKYPSPL